MDLDPKSLVGKTYRYTEKAKNSLRGKSRTFGLNDRGALIDAPSGDELAQEFILDSINDGSLVEVPSPPTERLCDCGRPASDLSVRYADARPCGCPGLYCDACGNNTADENNGRHNAKHHPRVEPKRGDRFRLKDTWAPDEWPVGLECSYRCTNEHEICEFDAAPGGRNPVLYLTPANAKVYLEPLPAEPPKPVEPAQSTPVLPTAEVPATLSGAYPSLGTGTRTLAPTCSCLNDDPGHLDPSCPQFIAPSVKPEAVCACLKCDECRSKLFADQTTAGVTLVHNLVSRTRPTLFPEVSPKPVRHYSPSGLVGGRWSW